MTIAPEGMADWLSKTQAEVIECVGLKCGRDLSLTLAVLEGAARDVGTLYRVNFVQHMQIKQEKDDKEFE